MPGAGGQQPQRTTFRPPWVKDGPNPLPMPAAPWTLNSRRESKTTTDEAPAFTKVTLKSVPKPVEAMSPQPAEGSPPPLKKQSKITIIPSQPKSERPERSERPDRSGKSSGTPSTAKTGENGRTVTTSQRPQQLERQIRVERSRSRGDNVPLSKSESTTGAPTLSKSSSRAAIPPPPPPRPPPPPPSRIVLKDLPKLNDSQQKTLEMLKSRPRKRPDWASMMKEVESGRRLKHVRCNDRSAPLIERVDKVTGDSAGKAHFVFESEKSNMHNQLLKQIQSGVKLKSVKTNDRSRPVLAGLRKFRRQLTIEEQMQKAEMAPVEEVVPDELDDIDAVRDDLQSTKQMLALELRNKEALERDNKRLQARILNLEVEAERSKSQKSVREHKRQDEELAESLRREAEQARKDAERLEKDFARVADERDETRNELEELKRMYAALERRMKAEYWESIEINDPIILFPDENVDASWYDVSGMALAGCPSAKDVARIASQKSMDKAEKSQTGGGPQGENDDEEDEEEEEESTEDEEEEDSDAAAEKRLVREFKLLKTKIKNFKDKSINAKKERHALREQIKQQNKLLREEKKKFKHLQKEVDKMAKLMGDTEEEEEEHDGENERDEEEEDDDEETESEEESETDDSELDDVWDSDDEDDPPEKRRVKLQKTVKKHEGRLAALKKGNYLLKAQVDRLKDDLIKQREESISLQEDLDSVLAELG